MVRQTSNLLLIPLQAFVHSHTLAKPLTLASRADFAILIPSHATPPNVSSPIPRNQLFCCTDFTSHCLAAHNTLHQLLPHLRHSKSLVFLFYELLFFPPHTLHCLWHRQLLALKRRNNDDGEQKKTTWHNFHQYSHFTLLVCVGCRH